MSNDRSRYALVSRRALLLRAAAAGTLALAPGLACSKSDEEVFATTNASTTAPSTTTPSTTAPRTTTTVPRATTVPPAATAAPTTAPRAASGAPLPASSKLTVNFSFTPAGGGRILNPYVAVWIEDASGALVRTVALWIKADKTRYVNELRRWYSVDRARIGAGGKDTMTTISSATKVAGTYSVVWDAKDDTGTLVAAGPYFVCIEAAREHGPYELIRQPVTLGAAPIKATFPDNGELTSASAVFVV